MSPVPHLIAFCVASMKVDHLPHVVLLIPHARLLRLAGLGAIVPKGNYYASDIRD